MELALLSLIFLVSVANLVNTQLRTKPDIRTDRLLTKIEYLEDSLDKFTATVDAEAAEFVVRLDNGVVAYRGDSGSQARNCFLRHKGQGVPVKFLQNGAVRDRFPRR